VAPTCVARRASYLLGMLIGDVAIALLKAGADKDKKTKDDALALDLAPDQAVRLCCTSLNASCTANMDAAQVRKWIEREAEHEGIDL
jgi:hypothetical protein